MIEMLRRILDAHGGLDRWNGYNKVEATIVSGGGFFPLKGVLQDRTPRRMTVWLHEQRSSVFPYGSADQCSVAENSSSFARLSDVQMKFLKLSTK